MTMEEGFKILELIPILMKEVTLLREELKDVKSFKVNTMTDLCNYLNISRATGYKLINNGFLIENIHFSFNNGKKIWDMKKLQLFKLSYQKGTHKLNNELHEALNILKAS